MKEVYTFTGKRIKAVRNITAGVAVIYRDGFPVNTRVDRGKFSRILLKNRSFFIEVESAGICQYIDRYGSTMNLLTDTGLTHIWQAYSDHTKLAVLKKGKKFRNDPDYLQRNGIMYSKEKFEKKYNISRNDLPTLDAGEIEILNDVPMIYLESAPTSCMTGKAHFTDFYNLLGCEAITYSVNGTLRARAVIWNIGGRKIVDRIYSHTSSAAEKIRLYAKANGWDHRINDVAYHGEFVSGETYKISLRNVRHCRIPWLDTFKYVHINTKTGEVYISNHMEENNYNTIIREAQTQSGFRIGCDFCTAKECNPKYRCVICGQDAEEETRDSNGDYFCQDHETKRDIIICASCHCEIEDGDEYSTDDGPVCENCFNEYYFTCDRCGGTHNNDNLHRAGDDLFCQSCFDRFFSHCSNCGEAVHNDYSYNQNGYVYCADCHHYLFTECDHCGDAVDAGDTTEVNSGEFVCDHCLENNYFECEECGEYFPNTDKKTHETRELCPECFESLTNKE